MLFLWEWGFGEVRKSVKIKKMKGGAYGFWSLGAFLGGFGVGVGLFKGLS